MDVIGSILDKIINQKILLFLTLLLVNVTIVVLACILLPVHFETVDDVYMCMIANGNYMGEPDCHLVYINAIYGWLLNGLYIIMPNIEWYTISFLSFIVISCTIIDYVLIKYNERINKVTKTLFILFLYILVLRFIQTLQFTTTAGLLCFSGCLLLYNNKKKHSIVGIILILIASLLRYKAAALIGIMWLPIYIYKYGVNLNAYIKFVPLVIFVLILKIINISFYSSDEWQNFREYNTMRSKVQDYPNKHNVSQNIINEDDYSLFIWFCTDVNIVNQEILRKLNNIISKDFSAANISQLSPYFFVLVLIIIYSLLCCIFASNKTRIFIILYSLYWILLLVVLSIDSNVKQRVFYLFLLPCINTLLLLNEDNNSHKICNYAFVVLMIMLVGKYTKQLISYKYAIANKINTYIEQLQVLEEAPESSIIFPVPTTTSLWYQYDNPFCYYKWKYIICENSSFANSPLQYNKVNSYDELIKENVFLFIDHSVSDNDKGLEMIIESIHRNYGIDTKLISVANNTRCELYKLVKE